MLTRISYIVYLKKIPTSKQWSIDLYGYTDLCMSSDHGLFYRKKRDQPSIFTRLHGTRITVLWHLLCSIHFIRLAL
jgi:hypothetical protein